MHSKRFVKYYEGIESFYHKLKFSRADGENLRHFKLKLFYLINKNHSLKYLRSTTLDCNDKGIKKSEFMARTQFLCLEILPEEYRSIVSSLSVAPTPTETFSIYSKVLTDS